MKDRPRVKISLLGHTMLVNVCINPTFWPNIFSEFLGRIFLTNRTVILHMTKIYNRPDMNRPMIVIYSTFSKKRILVRLKFQPIRSTKNWFYYFWIFNLHIKKAVYIIMYIYTLDKKYS
jgi:hypothetical protein